MKQILPRGETGASPLRKNLEAFEEGGDVLWKIVPGDPALFRHTHATLADKVGMAPTDRQAQLGHGDYRMAMLYTHEDLERRRHSIEAIENGVLGDKKKT